MRWMRGFILIGCILLLTACSVQQEKAPTLKPAELSESEQQLIQAGGSDYSYVYNLEMNDADAEMIELTVEHYEKGKKVEDTAGFGSYLPTGEDIDSKTNRLVFTAASFGAGVEKNGEAEQQDTHQRFVLTHLNGGGSSSTSRLIEDEEANVLAGMGRGGMIHLEFDQPVKLAALFKHTHSDFSVPGSLLEDNEEEFLEKIADFEHVYVFTIKLLDKVPEKYQ
ncbi:hypothetical protein [Alkalihalobacillus sp. TS-13]|uniref:hypothetical protein n=1 Tax=Alkalihalobacillus sp. TS-13 TaxID=2842455 RepID=UPI001C87FF5E|nr:hypothetical protein [Alkalihalobacillus sp. TS-13]